MKKLRLPLLLWLVLWLAGSFGAAWSLQRAVTRAASQVLAARAESWATSTHLHASASGRALFLRGVAARESDVVSAMSGLRSEVRVPGWFGLGPSFDPVRRLQDDVRHERLPSGWGVLSASAAAVRMFGATGSVMERERVVTGLRTGGNSVGSVDAQIDVDDATWVESDHLEKTLGTTPLLTPEARKQGLLAVARWGDEWKVLDLEAPVEKLRHELLAGGMSDQAWIEAVAGEVERLRDQHRSWLAVRDAEARRASLPPGHVVLALRADTILVRGEIGDAEARDLLLDKIRLTAGERRLITELRFTANRRSEKDVAKLTASLPKLAPGRMATMLAVGTPSGGWTELSLATIDAQDESTLGADALPAGLDRRLVLPDVLVAVSWLHSIDSEPTTRDAAHPLPHLVLAGIGDRILVRGAVPDEATRAQVETAVRSRYEARKIDVAIRLDAQCEPVEAILQTTSSLPAAPALNTTGLLAVAVAGDAWRTRTIRADLLSAAGIEKSGVLPPGLPVLQIMPDVLDIAGAARAHLSKVQSAPPGIPLQTP